MEDLQACIKGILVQFKREPAVERCVKYVVRLTTHAGEGDEAPLEDAFAMNLLEWLLNNSRAKDKAVRYRVCQLVQCIMNSLSDDAEISDVLWDTLQESMLERLRDKVPLVRAHAVAALERLQDPSDKEDPVCTEYIRMLQADTSNVVRKAVITHVGISKYTLRHVLKRARDVKDDVRAHLFSSLGNKLEMRVLSIKQRIQLLSDGLMDRSAVVREACLDLMRAWLKQSGHPVQVHKLRCIVFTLSDFALNTK
jgi:condensin complex subunit 3